jgi:outer membrane scaffolding protein for murein synthesis (MipA/OmpV family)
MLLRKKTVLLFLGILAIVALVAGLPVFAATDEVEISGTVFASEWDANDNVTAVVIATEEGEEIAVSPSGKGKELLKLEERNVKATGSIVTDQEGRKTINITKYMIQE